MPVRDPVSTRGQMLVAVAATVIAVALSELVRTLFAVPNPLLVTLLAVVYLAARYGTRAGLVSAAIIVGYAVSLYEAGWLDALPPTSASRAIAVWILAPAMAIIVGALKGRQAHDAQEILDHEAGYRRLVELGPNAVIVQADGRFLFVNDEALRLFGATDREQLVGRPVIDFIDADSRAATVTPFGDAGLDDGVPVATVRVHRLDGTTIELESMASPVRFDNRDATQAILRDVTNRFALMRAQAAITLSAQQESHFRLIAEAIPQIVWTATPDGWLDYYNPRWFDYTGMTLEQTQGWGWGPVLHPDDLQPCIDRWTMAFTTGEPYEIEYRFKRASDGTYRWHLGRGTPVRGDDGTIVKWLGTCTDIEEQKRSIDALVQSEARARSQIDQSPLSSALFDLAGVPFYSNRAYETLWGHPATTIGASRTIFDDPQLGARDIAPLVRRAFEGEHVVLPLLRYEAAMIHRDVVWIQATVYAVRDSNGRVDHVALMQEDVTARQKAEDAHSAAQERFRAVLDASPDGFALLRPIRDATSQIADFEFLYSNPAGNRAMDGSAPLASGLTLVGAFPHLGGSSLFAEFRRVLDSGEPFRGEHREGLGEMVRWTAITAIRVGQELAVTYADTTLRHVAEENLEQSNVMLERRVAERTAALQESEARYKSVLAATPDGIGLQFADYSMGAWNAAAERLTGITADQLIGRAPRPAGWEAVTEHGSRFPLHEHPSLIALRTGIPQVDRVMGIRHPDGRLVWISMNTIPLTRGGDAAPYAAITSFADITARRATELALRESEQRFALLAMQAPVGIFHTDATGSCTFVNGRYCELTGILPSDALGDGWGRIIHPEDRERVSAEWMDAARQGRSFRLEYRLQTINGDALWVEGSAEALVGSDGVVTGYIGSVHDLSERKRTEDKLREVSLHDELTGLHNRRGFFALASRECLRARRQHATVLVLYADVDSFKSINDAHGHRAGDAALVHVAAALRASYRDTDVIARMGGDEFVALSVHESPAVAAIAEVAMRARLTAHLLSGRAERAFDIRLSAGSATTEDPAVTLEALLALADDSLYESKRLLRETDIS